MAESAATATTHQTLDAFWAALASRDLRRIEDLLAPDVTWRNMPHATAVGRPAVMALLAAIVTWSDEVRWDVISASFGDNQAWVERVDRFVLDGTEHRVECNGVFTVAGGQIREVRDYVDLGEWRSRVGNLLERFAQRSPVEVVRRHLDGVASGVTAAMAADYALDAVLTRPDGSRHGWRAIADYFDTVGERLDGGIVHFDAVEPHGADGARVSWHIERDGISAASGFDTYVISGGRICQQVVELATSDF
jgi:limonene-1,2-epoxide hydrolase